jgi:hypothetical protein
MVKRTPGGMFIFVPFEIESDVVDGKVTQEIIFDSETPGKREVGLGTSQHMPIGYIDYGGTQGDRIDLRLFISKRALLPE